MPRAVGPHQHARKNKFKLTQESQTENFKIYTVKENQELLISITDVHKRPRRASRDLVKPALY